MPTRCRALPGAVCVRQMPALLTGGRTVGHKCCLLSAGGAGGGVSISGAHKSSRESPAVSHSACVVWKW